MDKPAAPQVLIAEDELLLAMDLSDRLTEAGYRVLGPARTLAAARALAAGAEPIDLALLDLNLGGDSALPVVRDLVARGIPVFLTTGYEQAELPDDLPQVQICVKPISGTALLKAMARALAARADI